MFSERYTYLFMTAVCVLCSLLLAFAVQALAVPQARNVEVERQKNVLRVMSLWDGVEKVTADEVGRRFATVEEKFVDAAGNETTVRDGGATTVRDGVLPMYVRKDDGTIVIPVEGMGLWSLLKGYFALHSDGHTVAGITFYQQLETPGLGAEISTPAFTSQYPGKDILNGTGALVGITAVKGKASDFPAAQQINLVDGLSGATMTMKGVNTLLHKGLVAYQPYLAKKWNSAPAPAADTAQGSSPASPDTTATTEGQAL